MYFCWRFCLNFNWFTKLCTEDKAIYKMDIKFLSNDTDYSTNPNPNQFHCCISGSVPAGCSISFFSIRRFLLGGTREEMPAEKRC